jgi:multimeric flavodoxin WrbA
MKSPEDALGKCYLADDMDNLLKTVLLSEKLIVSSPVNCYDLPSIMRIMLERMGVFCYWSDDMYSPKIRPIKKKIKGMLITTSALPGVLVPVLTNVRKTFRLFAKPIGVQHIEYFHIGLKGRRVDLNFTDKDRKLCNKIVDKLSC